MATLDGDFESQLREALLDDAEHELVGKRDSVVHQAIQKAHDQLREAGQQHGYNVESIIESLGEVEVERTDNSLTVRWGWEHEAAGFFEYGTPDNYTIDGDPVLSFVWEDPPDWVTQEFEPEGDGYRVFFASVDSGDGIVETRYVRQSLEWLRQEVRT